MILHTTSMSLNVDQYKCCWFCEEADSNCIWWKMRQKSYKIYKSYLLLCESTGSEIYKMWPWVGFLPSVGFFERQILIILFLFIFFCWRLSLRGLLALKIHSIAYSFCSCFALKKIAPKENQLLQNIFHCLCWRSFHILYTK